MSLTSSEVDFVEHIAQEQIRYETIFTKQRDVLLTDRAKYDEAIAQTRKSPLVAKPGQFWEPTQDKVDEYLSKCDEICHSVPQNFEELSVMQLFSGFRLTSDQFSRVKIIFAAHAALICMTTCKIAQQRERVQLAILRRHNEIS
jgi:hypothetical protein